MCSKVCREVLPSHGQSYSEIAGGGLQDWRDITASQIAHTTLGKAVHTFSILVIKDIFQCIFSDDVICGVVLKRNIEYLTPFYDANKIHIYKN